MGRVLSKRLIKRTKRIHYCFICDKKIQAGSTCHRQTNVGADWGFCTVYWHTDCSKDFRYDD